jgi:mono/diheme cytochrome c family protein
MRSICVAISIFSVALVGSAVAGHAQGMEIGKNEYSRFCASCHGTTGKGDGAVAGSLRRSPTDLTKLSDANFGVFPFARVYDVIDGRFEVETHGKREMPVWGEVFEHAAGAAQIRVFPYDVSTEMSESMVRARILALIDYIFTLQAKPK